MKFEQEFLNGVKVGFETGSFDDWQVNIIDQNGEKHAPLDREYFSELLVLKDLIGAEETYELFVKIFEKTEKTVDPRVIRFISEVAEELNEIKSDIDILFTIIYYTMIAEENKSFTKLGKRIKRLGIHQILIEGMNERTAANYSKGMKWREIDSLCQERGF